MVSGSVEGRTTVPKLKSDLNTVLTCFSPISKDKHLLMLLVLECGDEAKLATYHTKLMQTEWKRKEELSVELKGLNLDAVWENIIIQIGGITVDQGNTLDEQIAVDEQRMRIQKEIDGLTKQAKNEKQPKKKFELVQKMNRLKKELEEN